METSQTIGKLTVALAKAQGEIEAAKKDSLNPHFRSKYADLASVRDAIQAALSKHGIAYVQFPEGGPDTVTITTVLACGDEWMRASYEMRPAKADPQGMGSAITYARRYALAAAVGVAPEDDDGNAASGRQDTNGAKIVRPTLAPSPVDKQNAAQSRADVTPEATSSAGEPPAPSPAFSAVAMQCMERFDLVDDVDGYKAAQKFAMDNQSFLTAEEKKALNELSRRVGARLREAA